MPTPIPGGEITAFENVVNSAPYPGGSFGVYVLQSYFTNFEDIPRAIGDQLDLFGPNNTYLVEAMNSFNPSYSTLASVGILFKNPGTNATNPVLIINSNYTGTITINSAIAGLTILGNSAISKIVIATGISLPNLYIGPGASVDVLDSSATGAFVNNIYLAYAKNTASSLNSVMVGSGIGNVQVDDGSYYGGVSPNDPDLTCAAAVTGLAAGDITHNSVVLAWTPYVNGGYIFTNVLYKKNESAVWLPVDDTVGDYVYTAGVFTGFVFRNLDTDTYYNFNVAVTCNNGGVANTYINAQTVCCGSNNNIVPATNCKIVVLIKTSPNPANTITLCNGVVIPAEYPVGTTLTIPYLANKNITADLVIDNAIYQLFPYNSVTGTWDASTTPVLEFINGNVVTIRAQLPI